MDTQTYTVAIAAMEHWAHIAADLPDLSDSDQAVGVLLRQSARMAAGVSAVPSTRWPELLDGPLLSIFSRMTQAGGEPQPAAVFQPASLQLHNELLFPIADAAAARDSPVHGVVAELHAALAELDRRSLGPEARLEGLLFVLQRHAWSLPSPVAAVSLYDFARTHAALAAALAADHTGNICLIGGDLSGVQEFIYSVPAAGATRQLRGRSLYLQLLTDACAHAVLHATGMPLCNLLYAGGGRFYALLPAVALASIARQRREIGARLLDAHGGTLYLALGGVSFSPADYSAETWVALNEAIEQDKRRRFAELDAARFKALFAPRQPPPPRDDAAEGDEPPDAMGESLEKLGSRLSRALGLLAAPGSPDTLGGDAVSHAVLASLGLSVRLLDDEGVYHFDRSKRRRLLLLSDERPPDLARLLGPQDVVGTRYTVTEAPLATAADVEEYQRRGLASDDQELRAGHVKPFDLLAAQSQGVQRLGVLRMDVDDLGELFRNLDRAEGVAGLATTAALSAALSRFFEGWVGELCRRQNQDGANGGVYAVYSGGDDLFIVGSWHRMPVLARAIREDFARYVLGRPLQGAEAPPISLSAGLTMHGAGYPLYQAAEDAAEALQAAKAFKRADGRGKDAITFLGRTLGWAQFAEAMELCAELVELVQARGAPRGLLMAIQRLDTQYRQGRQRRTREGAAQFAHGPWVWQGAYQLTRLAERAPGDAQRQIEDLRERIVGAEGVRARTIERAGLAARWAQLLIRERSTTKEER